MHCALNFFTLKLRAKLCRARNYLVFLQSHTTNSRPPLHAEIQLRHEPIGEFPPLLMSIATHSVGNAFCGVDYCFLYFLARRVLCLIRRVLCLVRRVLCLARRVLCLVRRALCLNTACRSTSDARTAIDQKTRRHARNITVRCTVENLISCSSATLRRDAFSLSTRTFSYSRTLSTVAAWCCHATAQCPYTPTMHRLALH